MTVPDDYKIVLTDAIAGLKTLDARSVGMIFTDPAYASLEHWRAMGTTTRLKKSKSSSNKWFPTVSDSYYVPFLQECLRVLQSNTYIFVMCDEETSHIIYASMREVGIDKGRIGFAYWRKVGKPDGPPCSKCGHQKLNPGTPGMGYPLRSVVEKIVFCKNGKPGIPEDKTMRNDLGQYWLEEPHLKGRDYYPTQKPVSIIESLIRISNLKPGSLIVDPFAGSGSTGEAAYNLGYRFLGFDVEQSAIDYFRDRKKQWNGSKANDSISLGEDSVLQFFME